MKVLLVIEGARPTEKETRVAELVAMLEEDDWWLDEVGDGLEVGFLNVEALDPDGIEPYSAGT